MNTEQIEVVVRVCIGVGSVLCTAIPALIGLIKARKAAKLAKTTAEKEVAENDMITQMNTLIDSAEQIFKQVDIVLKQSGDSAGPLKKDSVMSKLMAYAVSKGYSFDSEFWSTKIDEAVEFTRKVNAR